VNNLPKVVTQLRRGRASNSRDRKSDALPLSHRATQKHYAADQSIDWRSIKIAGGNGICLIHLNNKRSWKA